MIKPEKPTDHLGKRTGLKYLEYFVYWSVEASPTEENLYRVSHHAGQLLRRKRMGFPGAQSHQARTSQYTCLSFN